ncbi:TVG0653073 [Thermoplasma volcanium GSS1]|uniref:TVG0653073 protein n=1 Tax=Thermoplasma volcanium (strain ATCC 51530 / DSM 4299 / JCM 9571 / NBRC 15438 / GSS1) TaxID=273116 RepID=Q97B00_THEVO|nr:3'-5' exonuclease [Thermoplasma volcanium]BAB59801.1 TVG0653073 [Thermoplasma volcanium GSS1]
MQSQLTDNLRAFVKQIKKSELISFDIETLVEDGKFLNNENIIAISYCTGDLNCNVFVAESEGEEETILQNFDLLLGNVKPAIILGYNHTGYDIPLISYKIRNFKDYKFWNIREYFGSAYTLDVMYLVKNLTGKIMKLEDAISLYLGKSELEAKMIPSLNGMGKGEAIKYLWKNERKKFETYSLNDSISTLKIFYKIMCDG